MSGSEPATPTTVGGILSPPPSTPGPAPPRPSPATCFTAEIQQMMHGFGDCKKPLNESACLIDEIVHEQMITVLQQSEDIARQRNARFIGIEDFLFLLRKDKVKLRRLLRYLDVRDSKLSLAKMTPAEEEESTDTGDHSKQPRKRRKICQDFLSIIDQTGELLSLLDDTDADEVKHERALRAELQTKYMDVQQYLEFTEARHASFTPRFKSQRFRDWLLTGLNLDIKPNPMALEVLSYLAYETVAQIVDLALLVKRDAAAEDPFSRAAPAVSLSHSMLPSFPPNQSTVSATTPSTTQKSPSRSASPHNSPPSTPTTPIATSNNIGITSSNLATSLSSSLKSKSKKKKKPGSGDSRHLLSHRPIQPTEIREAIRRYGAPAGPFAAFMKCPVLRKPVLMAC